MHHDSTPIRTITLEDQGIDRIGGPCSATMRKPPPKRLRGGPWLTPQMMRQRQESRRKPGWERPCPHRATRMIAGKAYCDMHGPD